LVSCCDIDIAAASQSEVYLHTLQEMLKMFPTGSCTFPTPPKQIVAYLLIFGCMGHFKLIVFSELFFCVWIALIGFIF
jgi:hypothetical protein